MAPKDKLAAPSAKGHMKPRQTISRGHLRYLQLWKGAGVRFPNAARLGYFAFWPLPKPHDLTLSLCPSLKELRRSSSWASARPVRRFGVKVGELGDLFISGFGLAFEALKNLPSALANCFLKGP